MPNLKSKVARFPIVMLTGHSSTSQTVHSMKQGVEDYLIKGAVTEEALNRTVDNAIKKHRLQLQVEAQRGELARRNVEPESLNQALQMRAAERRRQQQEITDLNMRLHRAVFEGSHRIKNHLQVLGALVDMQLSDGDEQIPAEAFRRLGSQIKALAAIHDVLTITTKENAENNILPMKPLLERILPLLQSTAEAHPIRFLVEDVLLPVKYASSLVLLLNELVSNAIKHGQGEVEVVFRVGEGNGVLEVCDDGKGFPPDFDAGKAANTGFELVAAMAHIDLGGQVAYDNHPAGGGRVTISFPLPHTAGEETPVYAVTGVNTVLA